VALSEVDRVEAWRFSARRTLVVLATTVLVAAAAVYAALAAWVAGNV
jgi:hypothetical protein